MKLINELEKYKDSVNIYVFLNQILNINDTLYRAEKKLIRYYHELEFEADFLKISIEFFSKKIALKTEYDLDLFVKMSDFLTSAMSENSLKYNIPIEFIKLITEKKDKEYFTKIKHNRFNKLIFVPLNRMFLKNDGLSHKGYELFLSNETDMIQLPNISTIDDFQNILVGFSIDLC